MFFPVYPNGTTYRISGLPRSRPRNGHHTLTATQAMGTVDEIVIQGLDHLGTK